MSEIKKTAPLFVEGSAPAEPQGGPSIPKVSPAGDYEDMTLQPGQKLDVTLESATYSPGFAIARVTVSSARDMITIEAGHDGCLSLRLSHLDDREDYIDEIPFGDVMKILGDWETAQEAVGDE